MYENTSKPKHILEQTKVAWKHYRDLLKIEMKEHGCYLANWAWLGGRDNQDSLATWHEIFLEKSIPQLEFCNKIKFGW